MFTSMYLICSVTLLLLLVGNTKTKELDFEFAQNGYKMKFERAEVARYNKDYVYNFNVTTFKHNRTYTAFNITYKYKKAFDQQLKALIQAYKFGSNEYRQFPIRLQLGICTVFDKNIAGLGQFTKCRNFNECPLKREKIYNICNFTPDEGKFPPLIPSGRYMIEVNTLHHDIEIWTVRFYAEIYRPFNGK